MLIVTMLCFCTDTDSNE